MYGMGYHASQRMAARIAKLGVDPDAANRALRTGAEIDQLGARLEELTLMVEAMWNLLERAGHSREELENEIRALDAADRAIDGRQSPAGTKCASCGAMVEAGRGACTFCGNAMPSADPSAGLNPPG